jgi:putative ATP-dependent endonuclease of OLD family
VQISKIRIQNYRCFSDITLLFRSGLNVVLGENNAGKTALFNAMRLVFERGSQQLTVHDFHHATLNGDEPPRIVVTATIELEEADSAEDKAAVATWLTRVEFPWEAELSFVYELPEKDHETFKNLREAFGNGTDTQKSAYAVEVLQDRGRFVSKHFGGALENRFTAEPEFRAHFQCRFLDALRDAETHLESGSSTLLRRMLRQMLDRDSDEDERSEKEREFRNEGGKLVDGLNGRISTEPLFRTAREIWGAGQKGKPTLFGRLTELEVLKSIWLYLDHESHQHPVSHNGLGFNNSGSLATFTTIRRASSVAKPCAMSASAFLSLA